jgi:tetratricopeptide (TPR) repeat protein
LRWLRFPENPEQHETNRLTVTPDDPHRLRELASVHSDLKWAYYDAGRLEDALRTMRRAMDLWDQLDRQDGLDLPTLLGQVIGQGYFEGQFLAMLGRNEEALRSFERHRRRIEAILKDQRAIFLRNSGFSWGIDAWAVDQALCVASLGRVQLALGQTDQAARSLDEARISIASVANPISYHTMAFALGQMAALAGLGKPELTATERAERQALADRTVEALHRSIADGYKHLGYLQTSPVFDVLRPRADFQLLMMDLAFPPWPFDGDPPLPAVGND